MFQDSKMNTIIECRISRVNASVRMERPSIDFCQSPSTIMTSIAAQVVLHPTISRGLKFGGTTVGRDKVGVQF